MNDNNISGNNRIKYFSVREIAKNKQIIQIQSINRCSNNNERYKAAVAGKRRETDWFANEGFIGPIPCKYTNYSSFS